MRVTGPMISIIVPVFNRESLIADTLCSIIDQKYPHWECLVIDDGSADNTVARVRAIAKKEPKIKVYRRPSHRKGGGNAARNFGFELARGTYVTWVDSDDIIGADHYVRHLEMLEKSPGINATLSKAGLFTKKQGDLDGIWANIFKSPHVLDDMISGAVSWPILGVCWRKNWFKKPPFDEGITSAQEWLMHVNQLMNGLEYKVIDEITVYMRRHENRKVKSENGAKYLSRFKARLQVYKDLRTRGALWENREYFLLKNLVRNSKKIIETRELKPFFTAGATLLRLNVPFKYKIKLLQIVCIAFPLKFFFGKGEKLFRFNSTSYL